MKVLVIGDACEDHYYRGGYTRTNPEADAPLMSLRTHSVSMGMAANVLANVQAFGCDVTAALPLVPWSKKSRFYGPDQLTQILRVDEDVEAEPYRLQRRDYYKDFDLIVISDYNKGFVTDETISEVHYAASCPVFVDTKKTDLAPLSGPFFKINSREFAALTSEPDELIVTCGPGGCWYKDVNYPAAPVDVIDVCGAGDTFLATVSVSYARTKDMALSLTLANRYASRACGFPGVYVLSEFDVQ